MLTPQQPLLSGYTSFRHPEKDAHPRTFFILLLSLYFLEPPFITTFSPTQRLRQIPPIMSSLSDVDYNSLSRQLFEYKRRQGQIRQDLEKRSKKRFTDSEIEEQISAAMLATKALKLRLNNIPETIALPISSVAYKRFRQKIASTKQDIIHQHRGNSLILTMPSKEHNSLIYLCKAAISEMLVTNKNVVLLSSPPNKARSASFNSSDKVVVYPTTGITIKLEIDKHTKKSTLDTEPDLCMFTVAGPHKALTKLPTFVLEVATSQALYGRSGNIKVTALVPKLRQYIRKTNGRIRCAAGIKVDFRKGRICSLETHVAVYRLERDEGEGEDGFRIDGSVVKIIDKDGQLCREGGEGALEFHLRDFTYDDGPNTPDLDKNAVFRLEDSVIKEWVSGLMDGDTATVPGEEGYESGRNIRIADDPEDTDLEEERDTSFESMKTAVSSNGSRYQDSSEPSYSSDEHDEAEHEVCLADEGLD